MTPAHTYAHAYISTRAYTIQRNYNFVHTITKDTVTVTLLHHPPLIYQHLRADHKNVLGVESLWSEFSFQRQHEVE